MIDFKTDACKPFSIGIVTLLAGLTAPVASAQSLAGNLSPFEVVYEVGNNIISAGSAKLSLTRDGDEWTYSLSTKPTGIFKLTGKGKIQEISVFNVVSSADELQVQPKHYTFRQDEEARRSVDAWFNWDENELTYKTHGEEVTEAFSDPILDRLSVTLSVMGQLQRDGFDEALLQVFDGGNIKTVSFMNEGIETVETRIGPMETIKVRSQTASGSSRQTITWFAPSLDYVPVRIEQRKRGDLVARLTLSSLRNRVTEAGNASGFLPKLEAD